MRFKVILFLMAVLILLSGAGSFVLAGNLDRFAGAKGTLRIAGGTAHIPVMKEAAKRIMNINPNIRISIAGGGSGVGIKQAGEGLVNIGNSGRKATKDEIARYKLVVFKFAIDGIAVVVNPENPVKSLTKDQLENAFSGKLSRWYVLGWEDRGINVYTRDASSGTREVFWKKGLNKGEIAPKANFVKSHGAMKTSVSVDPFGIGYISIGYLDDTVASVSIDGISPTLKNVREENYEIARGLYMNTRGEPAGLAKLFIDYILSREGQEIVKEKGFIAIN